MRSRAEFVWIGSGWYPNTTTLYVYDGRRVVQERNSANGPTVSYVRGLDLSGTAEGAGGIGGLLARSSGYQTATGSWTSHAFYHADGGGNVTFLSPSTYSGTMTRYSYDAYGRTTSVNGPLATANVYRFSSKELHAASGHYHYGYRFYDPQAQRWINRDPLGEAGGMNLYGFVGNRALNRVDPDGLIELNSLDNETEANLLFDWIVQHMRPSGPTSASIGANIRVTQDNCFRYGWLYEQVKNGGPWDYKQYPESSTTLQELAELSYASPASRLRSSFRFQVFGNFHYGAVASAMFLPPEAIRRMAGWAQVRAKTSCPDWGHPGAFVGKFPILGTGTPPYGDDPKDQYWINAGMIYYMWLKHPNSYK